LEPEYAEITWEKGRIFILQGKEEHPCSCVTWYGAIAFCNFLSSINGLEECYDIPGMKCNWDCNGYRLPTAGEWEYAARGGRNEISTIFAGSNNLNDVGWYDENTRGRSKGKAHFHPNMGLEVIYLGRTKPVGKKNANELKIFDMSGNVQEWCWDWFADNDWKSGNSKQISRNPKGPENGVLKVILGGSAYLGERPSRMGWYAVGVAALANKTVGFRVVRSKIRD
jgi:formylglycine-generating enzyme required for sulfatase activity